MAKLEDEGFKLIDELAGIFPREAANQRVRLEACRSRLAAPGADGRTRAHRQSRRSARSLVRKCGTRARNLVP